MPERTRIPRSPRRDEIVLVKLGGSLLTDKRGKEKPRREIIARVAAEIAAARSAGCPRLVLGHGSGSFGHVAAHRHGFGEPATPPQQRIAGFAEVAASAARLHRIVVEALLEAGERPASLPPSGWMMARSGRPVRCCLDPLYAALDSGLLPVVHGDPILDSRLGATIASTEMVLSTLAQKLLHRGHALRRALWLGETPGVLDAHGETIPSLDVPAFFRLNDDLRGASGVDVTGGIRLRVETALRLARLGISSSLCDGREPDLLRRALLGESAPGTLIAGL